MGPLVDGVGGSLGLLHRGEVRNTLPLLLNLHTTSPIGMLPLGSSNLIYRLPQGVPFLLRAVHLLGSKALDRAGLPEVGVDEFIFFLGFDWRLPVVGSIVGSSQALSEKS